MSVTVLGIETSTAVCSIAVCQDGGSSWERRVIESHIHSEKLLTLVQSVCEEAHVSLAMVDGVAVSSGPGSFTGLRIGMSAAKGLCLGLAKPLLLVPSFDAIADAAFKEFPNAASFAVCLDAKQGDFYIGRYECASGRVRLRSAVITASIRTFAEGCAEDVVITDREEVIREHVPSVERIVDVLRICNALPVAKIGLRMLEEGRSANLAAAEPAYLKDFVIRTGSITSH
jgi:tRNA threonylcarbamoyladenosine biosynthesis protein TsaB